MSRPELASCVWGLGEEETVIFIVLWVSKLYRNLSGGAQLDQNGGLFRLTRVGRKSLRQAPFALVAPVQHDPVA